MAMSVIITMTDSLISNEVDGEFIEILEALNLATASGKTFCAFDDVHGTKVMVNMPKILTVTERDE